MEPLEDESRTAEEFEHFKQQISNDSSLPQNMESLLLERYFKLCNGDQVKALELLKSNLKLRQSGPHIFTKRDVLSAQIQAISKIIQFCPLPKLTSDQKRILFIRFTTSDTSQYCCVDAIKMMLAMLDARYSIYDEKETLADADILILDLNGYSFKHFLNAVKNPKTLFLYFKYIQETVPIATVAAHVLNPSWVVDRFMSLIKPILRKEVADSFQFHSRGLESLYETVPKEVLPNEYGGTVGSIDDLHATWMKTFESRREYLLNDDNWKLTE